MVTPLPSLWSRAYFPPTWLGLRDKTPWHCDWSRGQWWGVQEHWDLLDRWYETNSLGLSFGQGSLVSRAPCVPHPWTFLGITLELPRRCGLGFLWEDSGGSSVSGLTLPFPKRPWFLTEFQPILSLPLYQDRRLVLPYTPTLPTPTELCLPACMLSRFSPVWFFATPWTIACQASLSMGFSRQEKRIEKKKKKKRKAEE